jgi:hypothetical protein
MDAIMINNQMATRIAAKLFTRLSLSPHASRPLLASCRLATIYFFSLA